MQHSAGKALQVTIVRAKGLRNADWSAFSRKDKSDPYCVCEIAEKPHAKFTTKVINDDLNPNWNHVGQIEDYIFGDTLLFSVWDKDQWNSDDLLGRASLASAQFHESGFDGELELSNAGRGVKASLTVKVVVVEMSGNTRRHPGENRSLCLKTNLR